MLKKNLEFRRLVKYRVPQAPGTLTDSRQSGNTPSPPPTENVDTLESAVK